MTLNTPSDRIRRRSSGCTSAANPTSFVSRRNLSLMYGRLGEVYLKRGDLAAALEYRRKSLALRETNLKADPVNAQARRDMSVTLEGIGDILDRMNCSPRSAGSKGGWDKRCQAWAV